MVKNLPTSVKDVQLVGREDPQEEGMTTHFSILAWKIPWTEEPGGLQAWDCKESVCLEWLIMHAQYDKYFEGK